MLIFNPRPETVTVQVCGKYFEFKSEQIKLIHNDNFGRMIITDKSYEGLVSVPDVCVEAPSTEEAIEAKKEARKVGISNRIRHLEQVKNNLLVSLQRDLDIKGLKIDALKLASDGEKRAIKELSRYEDMINREQEQEYEELKKLTERLDNGKPGKSDSAEASVGAKNISKSKASV